MQPNMFRIGRSDDSIASGPKTLRRAVALLPFGIIAINLHQLRVVNVRRERIRHSRQIHLVAVRGQLDSIQQAAFNIPKKLRRTPGVPPSDHPTDNELGLCFNGDECPNVPADPGLHLFDGNVLLLAADEGPDFIDLYTLSVNIADNAVLVFGAGVPDTSQQAKNRALRHIVKRRVKTVRISGCFLHFRPARFRGFPSAPAALFIGHGFQAALPADLAAFGSHLPHDLLDDGKFDSLSGFNGFQKNAPSVLDGIKLLGIASPLWHTSRVARLAEVRQEGGISNGPTTQLPISP